MYYTGCTGCTGQCSQLGVWGVQMVFKLTSSPPKIMNGMMHNGITTGRRAAVSQKGTHRWQVCEGLVGEGGAKG